MEALGFRIDIVKEIVKREICLEPPLERLPSLRLSDATAPVLGSSQNDLVFSVNAQGQLTS